MVFDFDGELLDSNKYPTIEDIGLTSSDLMVIEFKESSKPWSIKNNAVAVEGRCEGCSKVTILTHPCVCRKVSYCSEKCKINDERYHVPKCEKAASDDETIK
jgi:ubiquitin carboxyl-terminal hydrolase 4/11/15